MPHQLVVLVIAVIWNNHFKKLKNHKSWHKWIVQSNWEKQISLIYFDRNFSHKSQIKTHTFVIVWSYYWSFAKELDFGLPNGLLGQVLLLCFKK